MFALSLAQLRAHTSRLVATCLAIIIAVGFVVATLVLNETSKATVLGAVAAQYRDTDAVVTADVKPGTDIQLSTYPELVDQIRRMPAVAAVAADENTYTQVRLPGRRGYQYAEVTAVAADKVLQWQQVVAGRLPTGPGEVAVGKLKNVDVGSSLTLLVSPPAAETAATPDNGQALTEPKPATVKVVGVIDLRGGLGSGATRLFATPAQTIAWGGEGVEAIRVAGVPGTDPETLAPQIRETLTTSGKAGLLVRTGEEEAEVTSADYTGQAAALATILLVFGTVAVLVCALVIANTFAVLLAQRTRELALLRCVGATGRQLRRGVLIESLVIGTVASLIGVGAGIGLSAAVSAIAAQFNSPVPLSGVSVPTSAVAIGMAIGIVVTVVAAYAPARRATRVAPLAALRPMDAPAIRSRAGLLRRGAGVLLMIPSAAVLGHGARSGDLMIGLVGGVFSFIAVILLSQWLVPPVVALVGRLGGPAGGVPGRLAASNALRNPQRTAATATALIIGVTLTATMVVGAASTRATTATMLDRAFPTDISVTGQLSTDGTAGGLPARLEQALTAIPDVQAAMPLTSARVRLNGDPNSETRALGVDPARAASVVRSSEGAALPAPGTVNVPNWSKDTWGSEGARVTITQGDRSIVARVHSVSGDGPLMMTSTDLARLAPKAPLSEFWVRMADGLDADQRATALDAITGASSDLAPSSFVQSSTEQRDSFDKVINTLLMIVTGLLAVAVVIALIGVGNTIALSVLERRQESGLLRALGLTRVQLRWMLLWEAVLIAGVASLLGLLLGAAYGLLGTSAALRAEGPIKADLPWGQLLLILSVATVAGALASVLPSRRAARISPVAAIAT